MSESKKITTRTLYEKIVSLEKKVNELSETKSSSKNPGIMKIDQRSNEMHQMITDISAKLDIIIAATTNTSKPKPKPKSKPKSKTKSKKVVIPDSDAESETSEASELASQPATPQKIRRRTTPVVGKKVKTLDIRAYFKRQYADNSSVFDEYLTDEVVNKLEEDKADAWAKLSPAKKKTQRITTLYEYMRDNYKAILTSMKEKYNEDMKKQATVEIGQESDTD